MISDNFIRQVGRLTRLMANDQLDEDDLIVSHIEKEGITMPVEITVKFENGRDDFEAKIEEDGISFDVDWGYRLKNPKEIECLIQFLKTAKIYYE